MRQGMLALLLLVISVTITPVSAAYAQEMQPQTVQRWLHDDQIKTKVDELYKLAVDDKVDSLRFSLERLALPQQEVVRYLLLQNIEHEQLALTSKMAVFIDSQTKISPSYQVVNRGNGYEFSVPAFDYPVIASRLLRHWKQDQNTMNFILAAERGDLQLHKWLSGGSAHAHETILLHELPNLSTHALTSLTKQLTDKEVTSWLPATEVVVALAQNSKNKQIYDILWRMKADEYSREELRRLAAVGDNFSIQQLMHASSNPDLKQQAIKLLTKTTPLGPEVKKFLLARMAISEDAKFVAGELVKQGHAGWLREIVATDHAVRTSIIEDVLR